MIRRTVVKFAFVAVLSLGLFAVSCNKWEYLKAGHAVFGATLKIAEDKIDQYCSKGKIKQKDCEELHIRLSNIKNLHTSAGKILDSTEKLEATGQEVSMDGYTELFASSMEALENLYDFAKLCGFDLERR